MDIETGIAFGMSVCAIVGLCIMAFVQKPPQIIGRNEAVKRMLANRDDE